MLAISGVEDPHFFNLARRGAILTPDILPPLPVDPLTTVFEEHWADMYDAAERTDRAAIDNSLKALLESLSTRWNTIGQHTLANGETPVDPRDSWGNRTAYFLQEVMYRNDDNTNWLRLQKWWGQYLISQGRHWPGKIQDMDEVVQSTLVVDPKSGNPHIGGCTVETTYRDEVSVTTFKLELSGLGSTLSRSPFPIPNPHSQFHRQKFDSMSEYLQSSEEIIVPVRKAINKAHREGLPCVNAFTGAIDLSVKPRDVGFDFSRFYPLAPAV